MTEVSNWTLDDAIARIEAANPSTWFVVTETDRPLILESLRELRTRRAMDEHTARHLKDLEGMVRSLEMRIQILIRGGALWAGKATPGGEVRCGPTETE